MLGSKNRDYKTGNRFAEARVNVAVKTGDASGVMNGRYDEEVESEIKRIKDIQNKKRKIS
jgi:hypothetical protein